MTLRKDFTEHIDTAKHGPGAPRPAYQIVLVTVTITAALGAYVYGFFWLVLRALDL